MQVESEEDKKRRLVANTLATRNNVIISTSVAIAFAYIVISVIEKDYQNLTGWAEFLSILLFSFPFFSTFLTVSYFIYDKKKLYIPRNIYTGDTRPISVADNKILSRFIIREFI